MNLQSELNGPVPLPAFFFEQKNGPEEDSGPRQDPQATLAIGLIVIRQRSLRGMGTVLVPVTLSQTDCAVGP